MVCVSPALLVEAEIDKVATQYREAGKFLGMLRAYLREVADAQDAICQTLDAFDIDSAVGDQLTIIGKVLGWPRYHCSGARRPVFGFACTSDDCNIPSVLVAGFCEADFDCGNPDLVPFTFVDDELYRRFLKARVVTLLGDYRRMGVIEAAAHLFGDGAAIWREEPGSISIATGRRLSDVEVSILNLYRQVMPIAPGVELQLWQSAGAPFGFGAGWGGFCDGAWPVRATLN